ncbi:MAG: C40 family peptidase [Gemmatimonadaceae bacterium]|nr:C40 family peptidase [Gemmatimonadaceae bacterium]
MLLPVLGVLLAHHALSAGQGVTARPSAGTAAVLATTESPQFRAPAELEAHALRAWARGDSVTARREIAVASAYRWLGQPYRWGGIGYDGIDCSALMRAAYRRAGMTLPRTSSEQARLGREIGRVASQIVPADLLVFGRGARVTHVGMALGGGWFVHSAGNDRGVIVSRIADPAWRRLWIGTRRVIEDAARPEVAP